MKYNLRNIKARLKGRCEGKKAYNIYIYIYIIKREREVVGVHYRRSTLVEKGMDKTHNYPWSLSWW